MNNIYHIHEHNPYYVQAVAEHRVLHAAVEQLEHLIANGPATVATSGNVAEARRRMGDLRDLLRKHFDQEEAGGYLEEAIVLDPKTAPQAAQFQRQHHEFIEFLDSMRDLANRSDLDCKSWKSLGDGLSRFATQLNAHEVAENAMLRRAFNEAPDFDG
ncbi:MAG: hypothetical protein C0483_22560 [Pirellula sp.]|nr:hypothetical protein [Pirellula sp.]